MNLKKKKDEWGAGACGGHVVRASEGPQKSHLKDERATHVWGQEEEVQGEEAVGPWGKGAARWRLSPRDATATAKCEGSLSQGRTPGGRGRC